MVRVPEGMYKQFAAGAKLQGRTVSDVVRTMLIVRSGYKHNEICETLDSYDDQVERLSIAIENLKNINATADELNRQINAKENYILGLKDFNARLDERIANED